MPPSVVLQHKPFLVLLSLWLTTVMVWNLKLNLILKIWFLKISSFFLKILISFQISVIILLLSTNCGFCVKRQKLYHLYHWTTCLQYNCHTTQSSPGWSHLSAWIHHSVVASLPSLWRYSYECTTKHLCSHFSVNSWDQCFLLSI